MVIAIRVDEVLNAEERTAKRFGGAGQAPCFGLARYGTKNAKYFRSLQPGETSHMLFAVRDTVWRYDLLTSLNVLMDDYVRMRSPRVDHVGHANASLWFTRSPAWIRAIPPSVAVVLTRRTSVDSVDLRGLGRLPLLQQFGWPESARQDHCCNTLRMDEQRKITATRECCRGNVYEGT